MNKKGFTLIELLVVIAIIGLLSTLAVVALNNARCASGDMDACKKVYGNNEEVIEETLKCKEKKDTCRYACADEDSDLNDCLKRCDMKYEYCINKIED